MLPVPARVTSNSEPCHALRDLLCRPGLDALERHVVRQLELLLHIQLDDVRRRRGVIHAPRRFNLHLWAKKAEAPILGGFYCYV